MNAPCFLSAPKANDGFWGVTEIVGLIELGEQASLKGNSADLKASYSRQLDKRSVLST